MNDKERKALVGIMKDQIESWEFEDPREDWWKWQHQYAQAVDQIEADGQRIAELEDAVATLNTLWSREFEAHNKTQEKLLELGKHIMARAATKTKEQTNE
jgi:hypothetical protein